MSNEIDPFEFPDIDDAPIVNLCQKSPADMTKEELDSLIEATQSYANSAQKRKAAAAKVTKPASKSKLDMSQFL